MKATDYVTSDSSVLGLSIDGSDNLYIAMGIGRHRILRIRANNNTLEAIAGTGVESITPTGNGGSAKLAKFSYPFKAVADDQGSIYIADTMNKWVTPLYWHCLAGLHQDKCESWNIHLHMLCSVAR
jgi:hypothetical protein